MAKDEETKAVATAQQGGAVAVYDYGDDAGAGFENQTSSDLSIPFLAVLQAMSPQCEGEDAPGRPGQLYNTVSEEVYKGTEGVYFVPGVTQHVFVEWKPRDAGGGIVAIYQIDDPFVAQVKNASKEFGSLKTPNGNDLVETYYVYGVQCELDQDGKTLIPIGPLVVAFTSTKIKVYKAWNSRLNMFAHKKHGLAAKPPLFAHSVKITTVAEKNTKGSFYNFALAPAHGDVFASLLPPSSEAFQQARQIREMVNSGLAKANYDSQDKAGGGGADGGAGDPDKAPF